MIVHDAPSHLPYTLAHAIRRENPKLAVSERLQQDRCAWGVAAGFELARDRYDVAVPTRRTLTIFMP
jgi:hypothetical protein